LRDDYTLLSVALVGVEGTNTRITDRVIARESVRGSTRQTCETRAVAEYPACPANLGVVPQFSGKFGCIDRRPEELWKLRCKLILERVKCIQKTLNKRSFQEILASFAIELVAFDVEQTVVVASLAVIHLFTTASCARKVFQNQSPFLGVVFDLP
jgi:hypothetical protein